ncbi:uncharacterized protein F4822DRAFT_273705 [Hypoxylon trugodes]|uniref:uncharacterized protein n=1 Tax=Hypoxylon trugodes TaxID=326681 RepID=UPI002194AB8F|nr:uncharacterized protein F4822DRAFT_273705 [Hypoxylon trugodes]KAI1387099.1 hypothetical protein F4822DRAFT_273705 [Hypoxylon trugodes]
MQFTTLLAAAVLSMGIEAASVPRQNPNVVQFSGFRESNCSGSSSTGIYVVTKSEVATCRQLAAPAAGVGSVRSANVELYDAEGCSLEFYPTPDCTGESQDIDKESCLTVSSNTDFFSSFKVTC